MGELFDREIAATPEPFTGERLTAAIGGQVQIEHYHRYLFARTLCRGLDVVDVACGEGYGAAQIAQTARSVIGVDCALTAVRSAARNFRRPNLGYAQADARAMPLPDACVDAVVSFETIEHFDRQEDFVAEMRRVLRPGGICIVSTPDREIYSGQNPGANPFHVKELSRPEFLALFQACFPLVSILRQRPVLGSAMLADGESSPPPLVYDRCGDNCFEAGDRLPRAPYLIAVASDRPLPALPASLYIDRSDLDTAAIALEGRTRALSECQAALKAAEASQADLQAGLVKAQAETASLLQALSAAQQREAALDTALRETSAALTVAQAAVETSTNAASVTERARAEAAASAEALARELEMVRGSARTFLRGYLPRLRRHVLR
jgi:SAM-dependent methyltransferase